MRVRPYDPNAAWLREGHLAYFIHYAVEQFWLTHKNLGNQGRPKYVTTSAAQGGH